MLLFSITQDMLRFLRQRSVFSYKLVALQNLGKRLLTYLQVIVNNIIKYRLVVEDLTQIAELICCFALTKELYLQSILKKTKALELAIIKLYVRTLVFLFIVKQYLKQRTISIYIVSVMGIVINTLLERIAKSVFLTKLDLSSGLNEIQVVEKDVD